MKKVLLLLGLWIGLAQFALAQDAQYARDLMAVLCSPDMDGRGYVNKGEIKAANYLAEEMKRLGMLPMFKSTYLQGFSLKANSFPGRMQFKSDKKELTPGIDYLVHPDAPSMKGKYKTLHLDGSLLRDKPALENMLLSKGKGKVLVLDIRGIERYGKDRAVVDEMEVWLKTEAKLPIVAVVFLQDTKLTWFPAWEQVKRPLFLVKAAAFGEQCKYISLDIEASFNAKQGSQNVVGYIPGSVYPDSVVMITAHYDHLGRMGSQVFFPGANDNASGVAMALSLAKYYSKPENKLPYTLCVALFGSEEIGLIGSRFFAQKPPFALSRVKFLLNLDILGTGIDGITVVNGSVYKEKFDQLVQVNDTKGLLKQVKVRGEACISDHCFFHMQGVPSFYVYTMGGIDAYHDVNDKAETLTLEAFDNLITLFSAFIDDL